MTKPVVGLGQCSWDQLGRVENYPAVDAKTELLEFAEQGGGPVATALVTLARLGGQAQFFGTVGGDNYGDRIAASLAAEGVDISHLQVDPSGTSQVAFVVVERQQGRRNIFWHRGARRPFLLTDPAKKDLAEAAALLLDGSEADAALGAARWARQRGIPVILDGGSLRERAHDLLPWCDHLIVSERFARQLHPGPPEEALEILLGCGAAVAVVTLGAAGCIGRERDGLRVAVPAFAVDAVDTTGCGDVFHGGYLHALLEGRPLAERLRFASACAALKARRLGGRQGIPTLAEVEDLLCAGTAGRVS